MCNQMENPTEIRPANPAVSVYIAEAMRRQQLLYPPLETVTKPNLTTEELSFYSNQKPQTWRVKACRETYPEYLRPIRIGGRLNWPTAGVKKLCGVA